MGAFLRKTKEQLFGTGELKAGSTEQFWILEGMPRLGDPREERSLLIPPGALLEMEPGWKEPAEGSALGHSQQQARAAPAASSRSRGSTGGRERCWGVLGQEQGWEHPPALPAPPALGALQPRWAPARSRILGLQGFVGILPHSHICLVFHLGSSPMGSPGTAAQPRPLNSSKTHQNHPTHPTHPCGLSRSRAGSARGDTHTKQRPPRVTSSSFSPFLEPMASAGP